MIYLALYEDENRLNQQLTERINISFCGMSRPDNGTLGNVANILVSGYPAAEITGQNSSDYDKQKFHIVQLNKITKNYSIPKFIRPDERWHLPV